MNYYLLTYDLVDDYITRRAPLRDQHLRLAREAQARGEIVLAGAFADPPDGAALVFHASDQSAVKDFVRNDPYVINGLVKQWKIRLWSVVIATRSRRYEIPVLGPFKPGTPKPNEPRRSRSIAKVYSQRNSFVYLSVLCGRSAN